jgi:hypothetical protein
VWHAEPIASARTAVHGGEHARWSARTDAAGVAFLRGLPAETELDWDVRIGAGAFRDGRIALRAGETRVLAVALGGGARLAGRVLDERGAPVPGLALWCVRARMLRTHERQRYYQTVSDERGRFAFDDLELDRHAFGLPHGEQDFVELAPGTTVLVDRLHVEHDFRVRRAQFISGRVVGSAEEVAELVFAVARAEADGARRSAMIEEGAFRIGPLAPGAYDVRASGGSLGTARVRVQAGAEDVELGVLAAVEVPLRVDGAAGDVDYFLHDVESGILTSWSEPPGRTTVRVAPGRHVLVATAAGDRIALAELDVASGRAPREVALVLQVAARLTVVHHAEDRPRALRVRVGGATFPRRGAMDPDELLPGAARTLLVPPGPIEVELLEDGRVVAGERRVLAAGERLRAELVPGG